MPVVVTQSFYVEFDSLVLATPAWKVLNVGVLMGEADQKGDDTDVAHAHGGLANPRRRAITTRTLRMVVFGARDMNDAAYGNPSQGLLTNIAYLESNLWAPPSNTRTATLHIPGQSNRTGAVHVGNPQWGEWVDGRFAFCVFDVTIPAGKLS